MNTKQSRIRRARKTRAKIAAVKAIRLAIHRTNSHIYAQIISADGGTVMTSASSNDKELRAQLTNGGNVAAAAAVGKRLAEKAKGLGIEKVAFDRAGFRFHGRVKALAEAAREGGLAF
ncbi:MAG: 50S ribosomal protein L18 [Rhizobium sp.]|jgi:large subunit ribosomal protein L18|uniref:50S ribosomal protein L18 n=1 Tax=Thiobacillus sp. TaxID=924 RepID=UPI0025F9C9B4|nr:50S ribosomal protein L18 [Thiobacillus sp.]MBW8364653.1 50S ribosomal protein L18 [Rhizobium sp.]